jgi:type IV pilus assembly protein PilA
VWIAIGAAVVVVGMTLLIILMALAVPQVLRMKKNANQVSAVQTMKTIAAAELSYYSTYPTSGFGCPIAVLGGDPGVEPPSEQAAQLIDPVLASSAVKSGYVFAVTCGSKTAAKGNDIYNSFELIALPQAVGKTGDNGYCTDENNIIKIDPTGGTNCTQPLQ